MSDRLRGKADLAARPPRVSPPAAGQRTPDAGRVCSPSTRTRTLGAGEPRAFPAARAGGRGQTALADPRPRPGRPLAAVTRPCCPWSGARLRKAFGEAPARPGHPAGALASAGSEPGGSGLPPTPRHRGDKAHAHGCDAHGPRSAHPVHVAPRGVAAGFSASGHRYSHSGEGSRARGGWLRSRAGLEPGRPLQATASFLRAGLPGPPGESRVQERAEGPFLSPPTADIGDGTGDSVTG